VRDQATEVAPPPRKPLSPRLRRYLWVGAALLAVRFAFAFLVVGDETFFLANDSYAYLSLRDSLVRGEGYAQEGEAELFRPPGYPVFLALLSLLGLAGTRAIIAVQILIDALSALLVFRLSRHLFQRDAVAVAGALLFLAAPISLLHSCLILSETLFVLLLLAFFNLLFAARASWPLTPLGALLCYVRPISLALLTLALLVHLCRRRWRRAAALAIALSLLVPWMVRTHRYTGAYTFGTVATILFYRFHAAALVAQQRGTSFAEVQREFDARLAGHSQAQQFHIARRRISETLLAAPLSYLPIHVRTSAMLLLPSEGALLRMVGFDVGARGTLAVINSRGLLAGVRHYLGGQVAPVLVALPLLLITFGRYLLALLGLIKNLKLPVSAHHLLLLFSLVFVVVTGPDSHPRFRIPLTVVLSIYSGWALVWLLERRR
jgi:hypothetical protein